MMSPNTQTLLETALESLKKDILRTMEAHTREHNVPCASGLREFQHLVSLYWDLEAQVGRKQRAQSQPMAMAEEMACEPDRLR